MHPARKQKLIFILLGFFSVAVAVALVLWALGENLNHFYPPSEIVSGKAPAQQTIRVGGMVVKGSLKREKDSLQLEFIITDFKSDVLVKYTGILPDLFREGQGVVVIGQLMPDHKTVIAEQVLAKHDEKYMPPEAAEALRRAKNNK